MGTETAGSIPTTSTRSAPRGISPGAAFDEKGFRYDLNGNIRGLIRTWQGAAQDRLRYEYQGNRLHKLVDTVTTNPQSGFFVNANGTGAAQHYWYDANGNMTRDDNKGITSVQYNHLNLVTRVQKSATQYIDYMYDAAGTKLRSILVNGTGRDTTQYLGGFQYTGSNVDFITTAEGILKRQSGTTYEYQYILRDHLGSIRAIMAQSGTVLQRNDYYAFGLNMPNGAAGTEHKYQYNGKERQGVDINLGWTDYGARMYVAAIGRWHGVDVKASKFATFSPYAFTLNRPLTVVDPDGKDNVIYLYATASGKEQPKKNGTSARQISRQANRNFKELGLNTRVKVVKDNDKFNAKGIDKTDAVAVIGGSASDVKETGIALGVAGKGFISSGSNMGEGNPERSEIGGDFIGINAASVSNNSYDRFFGDRKEGENKSTEFGAFLINHGARHNAGHSHASDAPGRGVMIPGPDASWMNQYQISPSMSEVMSPSTTSNADYVKTMQKRFGTNTASPSSKIGVNVLEID